MVEIIGFARLGIYPDDVRYVGDSWEFKREFQDAENLIGLL